MRFAPQRRALFRCRNCQKWSEQTPCTFSISQLPQVVRPWCVLNILTSKCACTFWAAQLNFQTCFGNSLLCAFALRNVLRATTACTFSTSQLPKVLRTWNVLHIFTWKHAPHHNAVHFLNISTSKSGPNMWFWLGNVLRASQSRALFLHLNFQKCSDNEVFLAFSL